MNMFGVFCSVSVTSAASSVAHAPTYQRLCSGSVPVTNKTFPSARTLIYDYHGARMCRLTGRSLTSSSVIDWHRGVGATISIHGGGRGPEVSDSVGSDNNTAI